MTVASTTIRSDYAGNGTTGPFQFSFPCSGVNYLEIIQTSALGVDTTLAVTSGYTITGIKAPTDYTQGANITLITAIPADGSSLHIISNLDGTQNTDVKDNQRFYGYVHEQEFDYLALKDLQQQEQLNKSIKAPDSEPGGTANLTLPAVVDRKNTALWFDANGNAVATASSVPSAAVTPFMQIALALFNYRDFWAYLNLPIAEAGTPLMLATATVNDATYPGSNMALVVINNTYAGAVTLTGLRNGNIQNMGQRLTLFNPSAYTITLKNNNAGSSSANRFIGNGGSDYSLLANTSVDLIYSWSLQSWILDP